MTTTSGGFTPLGGHIHQFNLTTIKESKCLAIASSVPVLPESRPLQQLREAGYEVECFEKTDRVGGHWHTDYDALHLITSRNMTHFEGLHDAARSTRTFPVGTRFGATSSRTPVTTGITT